MRLEIPHYAASTSRSPATSSIIKYATVFFILVVNPLLHPDFYNQISRAFFRR